MAALTKFIVLGVGNILWADEGFGPRVVERLRQRSEYAVLPGNPELIDGGTQGLYLLPIIQEASHLLIFDVVDFNQPPGAVLVLCDEEIPAFFGERPLSLHQTAFTDVLAAAALTDSTPAKITLIGVQAAVLDDWGGGLSPPVLAAMEQVIQQGHEQLQRWNDEVNHYVSGNKFDRSHI